MSRRQPRQADELLAPVDCVLAAQDGARRPGTDNCRRVSSARANSTMAARV